jgi:tripartite-type tricarboxylate transporter receptor subunit TctC
MKKNGRLRALTSGIPAPEIKKRPAAARKSKSWRIDMRSRIFLVAVVCIILALSGLGVSLFLPMQSRERVTAIAYAQNPTFYQGKTIRIIVGSDSGGLYDLWARLFAKHMPKHIPGNPNMIVQNMPGAGGLAATNYLYGLTKSDGLTLGMFQAHRYMQQLTGAEEVKFDLRKFNWIGTMEKTEVMFYVRADVPYKSFDDVLKSSEPLKCGATGSTDGTYLLAKIFEETLGAKFNLVVGYQSGNAIDLAMEKGEVVCRGMIVTGHFSREPFLTWHKKGFDRHLAQSGQKRDPRMAEVPSLVELMDKYKTSDVSRRVAQVILAGNEYGRPMVATPGVASDRVRILREAYSRALKDPQLLEEAKQSKLEVEPASGEELQALTERVMNQSPEVIERVKRLVGN